jgi:biopolymer transport protein ExbD
MAHANLEGDEQGSVGITGINITPLVDIALVLLIVFLVTAKVIVAQAIPMQLPAASTPAAVEITLAVSIDADGSMAVDGARVADLDALPHA